MIQDIAPEVFRNQFVPGDHHPDPHDVVFIFDGRTVLCRVLEDGEIVFPRVADFAGGLPETPVYLFAIEDSAAEEGHLEFYLLREKDSARALGDGWQFGNIRLMRTIHPKDLCFAGMTGFQLYCWYRDNTFCGRCGGKTVYSDTERAIKCPACGNTIYPKVQPAVIIGLTDGDRILMSRYAGREQASRSQIFVITRASPGGSSRTCSSATTATSRARVRSASTKTNSPPPSGCSGTTSGRRTAAFPSRRR